TVPNTMLTGSAVRNNSALPQRRVQWTLTIKPNDDLDAVKQALKDCVKSRPGVLAEPAPQIYVQDWAEDKRVLVVAAWSAPENFQTLQQETLEELGKCLEAQRKTTQTKPS